MPIKLPKGFQRRKSSGNALDELPNPPEPSFRVFERPQGTKSFDGGNNYNNYKRLSLGRPLSAGQFAEEHLYVDSRTRNNPNNRGSGGTNNSASSGGLNDNSSSSARFSSTSTLPSSTDIPLDDKPSSNNKDVHKLPAPPVPESDPLYLRAAGRALSFGRKKGQSPSVPIPAPRPVVEQEQDGHVSFSRPRAMTERSYASGSTATPPKLLGAELEIEQSDLDGFGSMFETFGKSQGILVEDPGVLGTVNTESLENVSPAGSRNLTESYLDERSPHTASQPELTRSRDGPAASCSWGSDDSQEGMMTSTSQRAAEALNVYTNGTTSGVLSGQGLSKSRTIPLPGSTSPPHRKAAQRPPSNTQAAPHSNSVNASHKSSARESADFPILQDEDAKLAIDSLNTSQKLNRRSNSFNGDKDSDDEADNPNTSLIYPSPFQASSAEQALKPGDRQRSPEPLFDSSDRDFSATPWRQQSTETTPRAQKRELAHLEERSLFDSSPPNERSAPAPPSKVLPPPKAEMQKKVMTPAQFERYRKEQEMRRDQYFDHEVSDEEGDEYEDDDELERNKQLARERRKQEAHLSVYRQQMMKVTGEQPSDLPSVQPRARMDRSSISAPNLTNGSNTPTFSFDKPSEPSNGSDDEDEDIPLGVLAAHGFPTKNRPPTALSNAGSSIHYKSESYPPPPMSTVGASAGGASRGLPPFAKNLPPDPYYGAGLVNPSNRESLALGHGAPASVYGAPSPSISPGGLVGVIAGEERARAARRGSPNAQGNYSSPLPPGLAQMQMGMVPGVPPPMSPGEQATVQMSEQMNQMMQMQMQWMMQMQQMMASGVQGMPPGQQPPFALAPLQQQQVLKSPGMLAPPGNLQRPMSTGSHSAPGSPISPQQVQQRAMSMMGPTSAAGWQPQSGDRASVVPSLMSGALGSPSPGYTPSIAPSERSNVGMPSRYRPVSIAPVDEGAPRTGSRAFTFTSGMLQPGGSGRNSRVSASSDVQSKLSVRPVSQAAPQISQSSDDDDEEGWEEMKKKREERKNMRMKSSRNDHLGLDIYDYPQA